ncbi:MAG TPA: 2Fe-2S iron-sulfur cluster-binding protein [Pseudomonas sp.]|nr:2Fe-2S iron-sulfur cluster-binding protein [Pseudomonas sp.]
MPLITFITHNGDVRDVHVAAGVSVMQAALDNGVDAILGECGGACSCATCHCYIDPAWYDMAGAPGATEQAMIECALEPMATSRLGCQVIVTQTLDGIVVRLPASQF